MSHMPVIESFLVRDSRMLSPRAHAKRFTVSAGVFQAAAHELLKRAVREIPPHGLYFPLLSIDDGGVANIEIREWSDAKLSSTATLHVFEGVDERRRPRVKGPDFSWQYKIRDMAAAAGAADALLRDPARPDEYREAAFGSVVLWHEGELIVSSTSERLPSTTEAALQALAQERGVNVAQKPLTHELLLSADSVWLLSALHTIRAVTHIGGVRLRTVVDAAAWHADLWRNARPVSELSEAR